jgi:hypothetical protein
VRRSRWREIEFMFHQACGAILPPQRLVEVFRDWDENHRSLGGAAAEEEPLRRLLS